MSTDPKPPADLTPPPAAAPVPPVAPPAVEPPVVAAPPAPKITKADVEAAAAAARDAAMAEVYRKAGVKDAATLTALVEEHNKRLRADMSETEKIKADLAAEKTARLAAETLAAEEQGKREAAEKAHRMEAAENNIRTAFAAKGVQPGQMDVAMWLYQRHIQASETALVPEKFADEVLKRDRAYLFVQGAAPATTAPVNPAPGAVPPAAPPVIETVDDMSQQDFNKHVRDKYGFNPTMS